MDRTGLMNSHPGITFQRGVLVASGFLQEEEVIFGLNLSGHDGEQRRAAERKTPHGSFNQLEHRREPNHGYGTRQELRYFNEESSRNVRTGGRDWDREDQRHGDEYRDTRYQEIFNGPRGHNERYLEARPDFYRQERQERQEHFGRQGVEKLRRPQDPNRSTCNVVSGHHHDHHEDGPDETLLKSINFLNEIFHAIVAIKDPMKCVNAVIALTRSPVGESFKATNFFTSVSLRQLECAKQKKKEDNPYKFCLAVVHHIKSLLSARGEDETKIRRIKGYLRDSGASEWHDEFRQNRTND